MKNKPARDWVKCPICDEPDMRKESDGDDGFIISCTNLGCLSNGGTNGGKIAFKQACRIVENRCRSLGRDCQVMFSDDGVEIAPASWPGSAIGQTLFDALKEEEITE